MPNPPRLDPPRPRGRLPLVGHAVSLGRDTLGTLDRWANEVGDLYRIDIPGQDIWMVNRPDEIERIMLHTEHFVRGGSEMNHLELAWGNGLFMSQGALWKKQRHMMAPSFHKERIAEYGRRMVELTEQTISMWPAGEVRNLQSEMMALTLRIVTDALFSTDELPVEEVRKAIGVATRRFDGVRAVLPGWLIPGRYLRYRAAVAQLDRMVYDIIGRRRTHAPERRDLLAILLDARDEGGIGMSDRLLRDEVMGLLLAGHETTAVALTWAWYALAKHPEIARRVFDEAAALTGPPTVADLDRLPYIEAVVSETMRLYPANWVVPRLLLHDGDIGGYPAKRGAQVKMCAWTVHHDPRFFPEPLRFRPERWIDGSTSALHKYAYFPFGGGQRLCIGRAFALLEMCLVIATIARHSRFRPMSDDDVAAVPSVTLRPAGGLPVRLERR